MKVVPWSFLCTLLPVQNHYISVVVEGSHLLFLPEGEVEIVLGLVLREALLLLCFDRLCMADKRVVPHDQGAVQRDVTAHRPVGQQWSGASFLASRGDAAPRAGA